MNKQSLAGRFIGEPIEAIFYQEQIKTKNPGCPDAIRWRSNDYVISKVINQWTDFSRKGNMRRNMREAHRTRAEEKGSWGVGRIYFKVQVHTGQIFEIYFDRAPQKASDREGNWFLFQEYPCTP
ncbi:MAG TPA: DUF6504 family protein [Anaerolineaceae bacterium]|nr:DUF6504 family protein [Anaerolineaceae bacterium]